MVELILTLHRVNALEMTQNASGAWLVLHPGQTVW